MSSISVIPRMITRLSGGFILAFHDISSARVADFIDSLAPAKPIPLGELVNRVKLNRPTKRLFAITVDDGVGDTVRDLSQLFRKRQWPATFYLPTDYLDSGEPMSFQWWRSIRPLLPRKKLDLGFASVDLSGPGALDALEQRLEVLWHCKPSAASWSLIRELSEIAAEHNHVALSALHPNAPIGWDEVRDLARNEVIQFESHGVTHTAVAALSEEDLTAELRASRDLIAEHTSRPCRHFAYPFGSPLSIGSAAPAIASKFYDSAVTMTLGQVDFANPCLLPRIPLYPQNSRLRAHMKILLRCSSISPFRSVGSA